MASQTAIVIGGGLAGLAAATALSDSGVRIILLEKRPFLGGRATSYALPDGSHVDNCQHVTLGCCTNLDDFYRRAGAQSKIRRYDHLFFADRHGRVSQMYASPLPAPLHMAPSFLRFRALSFADKRGIARGLLRIARAGGHPVDSENISMREWLERNQQSQAAIRRFWGVVLVSALNEELDRMDARYGIDVFWKGFLANRRGYVLGIPAVPLGDLYEGCRQSVEKRGGELRLRSVVRGIRIAEGKFHSLVLDDGSGVSADACIAAVPHNVFLELLPSGVSEREPSFANLSCLHTSPITGVHFWFDRWIMSWPFLTLLDHTVQWIFNKSLLYATEGKTANESGQYLQMVISASYDFVSRSRQEIIDLCLSDLREVLPLARAAKLLKATVVKEVNATFSPEPGSDRWRPAQHTSIPGLFLAGDWTNTGWPATMEGAVRSGYLAAGALLNSLGLPGNHLVPDLPVEGLCRRWALE